MSRTTRHLGGILPLLVVALAGAVAETGDELGAAQSAAREIIATSGVRGGLIVHVGCGDGMLTAAFRAGPQFLVHGVDTDPALVAAARQHIASVGLYGDVAVDRWDGTHLPYADNLANLVVAEDDSDAVTTEAMRVLAPLGVLMARKGADWEKRTKGWPGDIDEWSHYLHEADNNAVAHDTRVGSPRSLQWIGSPRWARHHDRLASMSALVSAGGRLFYIFDEGPTASVVLPSKWALIARDAFNGVVLWKRPIEQWQTRLWPLKSGPAQLPRRLVATSDTVFATLGIDVPVTSLDAATGETLRTYEGTKGTEEILFSEGDLFVLVDASPNLAKYTDAARVSDPWWAGETKTIVALDAAFGQTLWQHEAAVVPLTLTVDGRRVLFHDGTRVVCLDRRDGNMLWESEPVRVVERIMSFFAPTLLVQDGVVLFAGGEESGLVKSTGGATKSDTLTALDGNSGAVLWTAEHPPSGYSSPEDLFVIDGTVWFAGTSNGGLPGALTGLDLRTGEVKSSYEAADVQTYWFHHRCYRGKATDRYLMVSRTGIEFIDLTTGHWDINHWVRGGCMYGIMPANGLLYAPCHACACYPESKLFGFAALGPEAPSPPQQVSEESRLERGPAYGKLEARNPEPETAVPWPTYRHDRQRSGATPEAVAPDLAETWKTDVGGPLSAVTAAEGKVFVAAINSHTVHALDASSGDWVWSYVAGGPVDSPPTIHDGTALFGCADGWIYCLRTSDGELVWRFRAAPQDSRIVAYEQLESRWPVHGSVLVRDGVVYAVAGRSLFLDGGMRLVRLDAATGELLSEGILDERDPETGENIQTLIKRLTMPVALPDVLSSDGKHVYMRSQVFDMEGGRIDIAPHSDKLGGHAAVQQGETEHLFSSAGFLDGTWFHRAYWMYGRSFEGGWNGYYLAGRRVPAGKILAFDDESVYGFGREPRYYRWTTPMEFNLFAAPKTMDTPEESVVEYQGSVIRVDRSESLNPAGIPVAVMAWVRTQQPDGVIVARGATVQGYSLYIKGGVPHLAIRADSEATDVSASGAISDDWTHLAGVVTSEGELRIYVNGALAGTASGPGPVPKDPAESMQIGGDEGGAVGAYEGGLPFKGIIDEVRIYHGDLPEAAIRSLAGIGDEADTGQASLVMYLSFDKDNASDSSGNKNHGTIVGAVPARGRTGSGMRFSGRLPEEVPSGVTHTWLSKVPLLVRGLLVAGRTLFIAGPDDLLDEPGALKVMDDPDTLKRLSDQEAALTGKSGGILRAVACDDGTVLSEQRLDTTPVWDGLAAADGSLYLAAMDGTVRCYRAR